MATRLLQSFLVGLGYDYEDEDLQNFKGDIEKVNSVVGTMVKAALAGAVALTGLVVATTAAADEQGKLAGEVNTSVEDIDALTHALQLSGGSADGMASSLRGIARRASEAQRGIGEGVEAFGLLGISVTNANGELKSSDQLLIEVAGAMEGLSAARQIELAEKLGLSGSIRLLQQGRDEVVRLTEDARALGVTTQKDAAIAAEFQDGLTRLWRVVKQISLTLTRELAPIMTRVSNTFLEWWKQNREIIQQNIAGFFDKAAQAARIFVAVLPFIAGAAVLTAFSKVLSFLRLATIRMGAFTLVTAALPIAFLVAKALLIGAIEDIFAFIDGKDSLFGELIEKHPDFAPILESVAAYFDTIRNIIKFSLDGLNQLIGLKDSFSLENIKEVAKNTPGFLSFLAEQAGDSLRQAGSGLLDATGIRSFEEQRRVARPVNRLGGRPVPSTLTNSVSGDTIINISGVQGAEEAVEEIKQAAQDLRSGVDQ